VSGLASVLPAAPNLPWLTAWDLKQHAYCPRVVFYCHVVPVRLYVPPKVRLGADVHAAVERLERRRSVRRYGLGRAAKRFEVRCRSERLRLSGTVDLVLETADRVCPVELKWTRHGPKPNVRVQLSAYALLLEEQTGLPARQAFLVEVPEMQVFDVALDQEDLAAVERRLGSIRRMFAEERLPPPTPDRAKCPDCELLAYCADVG
jgi:CRISPR-associated exonuclease Cas4